MQANNPHTDNIPILENSSIHPIESPELASNNIYIFEWDSLEFQQLKLEGRLKTFDQLLELLPPNTSNLLRLMLNKNVQLNKSTYVRGFNLPDNLDPNIFNPEERLNIHQLNSINNEFGGRFQLLNLMFANLKTSGHDRVSADLQYSNSSEINPSTLFLSPLKLSTGTFDKYFELPRSGMVGLSIYSDAGEKIIRKDINEYEVKGSWNKFRRCTLIFLDNNSS